MDQYFPHLKHLDKKRSFAAATLEEWVNIHSGTDNVSGLQEMASALQTTFSSLGGKMETLCLPPQKILQKNGEISLSPLGKALLITKRPKAAIQILFAGHMDIAFPANAVLEKCQKKGKDLLIGRGTADMKSGLLTAFFALDAFEKSPFSEKIGWRFIINPDEEIGSPGSSPLFQEAAKHSHLGLVFEPSLPDGSLVGTRKGSLNYTFVVKGKAAHAGRDFSKGVNALSNAARLALAAESLTDIKEDITVNIGYFEGGGPANIVPDQAIFKVNARVQKLQDFESIMQRVYQMVKNENTKGSAEFLVHQDSERPPKLFDKKTRKIFEFLKDCGASQGIKISWKSSGGACDGNLLAIEGLPTIDTLGGVGGNLHTSEEYVSISSILQRAKLTAKFLMQIAAGEVILPH